MLDTFRTLLVRLIDDSACIGGSTVRLSDYLQIKEAAALLGVAPNTLRSWDRTGKIRVYRHPVNNYRLYKKADLQRLLASIELPATSHEQPPIRENEPSS
jgi:DNA (cytosine-5)-methyltransferase 1